MLLKFRISLRQLLTTNCLRKFAFMEKELFVPAYLQDTYKF